MRMKVTDKYGFVDEMSPVKAVLANAGFIQPTSLADRLKGLNLQQPAQQQSFSYPTSRAMDQINPMYTKQQPMDALAPMLMYRNYMQTGQAPAQQSSFQPWNNPAQSVQSAPASPVASPIKTGGK